MLLILGTALRLWQYLGRSSLWLDELALAASILARPLPSLLTQPLLYDQVAPPGFLAAMKISTALFGDGELALRLFPLFCALASLGLFVSVARRVLDTAGALVATAMFALGVPFIRYAGEAKPYSTDLAVALVVTLFALELPVGDAPARPFWIAGLVGVAAAGFSQPAIFLLAGAGLGLAAGRMASGGPRRMRPLLPTLGLWTAACAAAAAMALRRTTPASRELMRHYWEPAFLDAGAKEAFGLWPLLRQLRRFWGGMGMSYPWPTAFLALTAIGFTLLFLRRRNAGLVLLGPVLVAFIAGVARIYPWDTRLILFLTPAFLLAAAAGGSGAVDLLGRARVPAVVTGLALALAPAVALARHLPVYRHEETRPLFEQLARRRRPGDAIYVFHGASQALRYYGARAGIPLSEVTLGECHRDDPAAYLREIDRLRGRPRVWVLIARSQRALHEQEILRGYLERIGRRRESLATPDGDRESTLELYDLSDPETQASSSAETFPIPAIDVALARRLGCGRGPDAESR